MSAVVRALSDALDRPFTRRDALAVLAWLDQNRDGLNVYGDLYDAFAVEWRKAEIDERLGMREEGDDVDKH